jgi:capsular polysaccharide biosynthesis protein
LFRRARLVIAPHGAGLTNIVACEPGTHVYELLPGAYDNYCYCRLAQACGLHYWCDVFPGEAADDAEPQERSWRADLDDVARTLGNIRARMIALLPTG